MEQPSTQTRTGSSRALLEESGKNFALEQVESFRVAEKTRDADEHVGVERVEFFGVAAEEIGVVLRRVVLVQHHAPGDAPLDGGGFVEREIHAGMVAQQQQNFFEAVLAPPAPLLPRARSPSARSASAAGLWPMDRFATYGCFAMRASSLAMFSGERTKSTQPAATALRGIESYLADSSCAKVIPPSALIASSPSVPSVAVPERITPMARSRWSCASDSKKESIEWCAPRPCGRG